MNYKELNEIMRKIRQAEEEFNKKLVEALNPVINVIDGTITKIEFAIKASTGTDAYRVGFRNGLRYALYLLDGKAPQYEFITMEET